MAVCDFYSTSAKGFELVGTIEFDGKRLDMKAEPGGEQLMDFVMKNKLLVGGQKIGPEVNPKGWFDALEDTYAGSYFRAAVRE